MPLDGIVVRNIIQELNKKIVNGKIDKISQPEIDEIILTIRNNGENYKLLLSSSPNYSRAQLTTANKQNPISAPMFCMVLRKHLTGGRIVKIEQYNLDRIIKIFVECYDELGNLSNKILLSEIMGRYSNIILLNEKNNLIVDSIKHITHEISSYRQVLPGVSYKYPPSQDKLEPLDFKAHDFRLRVNSTTDTQKLCKFISGTLNGFSTLSARELCYNAGIDGDITVNELDETSKDRLILSTERFINNIVNNNFSPCIFYHDTFIYDFYSFHLNHLGSMTYEPFSNIFQTIEQFYSRKDKAERMKQKSSDITKVVNNNLNRCIKKLSIQEEKLLECSQKQKWKLYGDLIMSNLYFLKKGDSKTTVSNFYDENQSPIEISLDFALSPVENAQNYYKKYNKDKTAELVVTQQREENIEEIQYFESQLVNIENSTDGNEIDEIRNELISLGYLKKGKKASSRKKIQSEPLHYISSDGTDIYVGKNNIQNDYLTLKFADSTDIWLHTKNIPGAHVIIKNQGKTISENTIYEAAIIAAYFSKARNSSNVSVDYTEKKNVRKPSGSKPGRVIYYTNRTAYVTPSIELIEKMKNIK